MRFNSIQLPELLSHCFYFVNNIHVRVVKIRCDWQTGKRKQKINNSVIYLTHLFVKGIKYRTFVQNLNKKKKKKKNEMLSEVLLFA